MVKRQTIDGIRLPDRRFGSGFTRAPAKGLKIPGSLGIRSAPFKREALCCMIILGDMSEYE